MRSRGQAGLASHRFPKGRRLENLKGGQRTGWQPGKDLGWAKTSFRAKISRREKANKSLPG